MPKNVTPTPQPPTRLVPGRSAGQREDLVQRLRDLASNYPSGIGILKEFLQNADDAGATWVRFTLDLRHHRAEQLPDSRMGHLLGPALLVDSDQSFSEQDVINIQRIGAAGKIADAGKTGRFGLGFNTVYSITDYPSFATRDLIMTFDPYFDTVAVQGEEPGFNWPLDALWRGGPDWPRAFDLPAEAGQIETTVFRLPLRSASQATEGRISRTPTHPDELKAILVSLAEWGERVVLYLRSVVHVEARVLHDGWEESLADVRTTNVEDVRAARGEVLPRPGESADHVFARAAEEDTSRVYPHRFSVVVGGETTESAWMVCQGLFLGEQGEVLDAAKGMTKIGEKAIPLGGAAMRVHDGPEGLLPLPTPGTLLCTLPIPQQLPIALALNGHWSLSSSRDHVRFGADKGEEAVKITWNKALAEVVVPAAVAELVAGIRDRLGIDGAAALYAALPDLRRLITPFDQALGAGLYRALAASPSIRVADAKACDWRLPSDATLPPGWSQTLIDTCISDGLDLAVPVPPEHVRHGLAEVDEALHTLTPAETLKWLKKVGVWAGPPASAPRACLRSRELVLELLRFCSEGGKAWLDGAPLAWMRDGSLRTFGHGPPICLGGDAARSLFRSRPSGSSTWSLSGWARTPDAGHEPHEMTPPMIKNLKTVLQKGSNGAWETLRGAALNEAWLIELYEWLAALPDLRSQLSQLELLEMVPDSKAPHTAWNTATPLLPPNDMGKALTQALHEHGVPIVRGSTRLLSAIRAFAIAAEGMVWDLTPNDVIDTLPNLAATFPAQSPTRPVLLRWFATAFERAELYSDALALLKDLPIWPTKDGRAVPASGEAVFLPDYEPPLGFTPVTLLEVEASWRPLIKELGVAPLDLGEWILCIFLNEYPNLDADRQAGALLWFRDRGMEALTGTDERAKKLREAVRKTPLIVSEDGALVPAADLYHPDAWEAVAFLGGAARFPDWRGVYSEQQEEWNNFFHRLNLLRHPRECDVITRVEGLLQDLTPESGDPTEAAMLEVYDFLEKRWAKSSDNEETPLAKGLRRLAWIPTMQRPHHTKVALFRRPAARFVLPADVYPSRLLHQGASQVAFFAGEQESSDVRKALGMPNEIRPEDALAHFIAVRDEWLATGGAGLSSEAVKKWPARSTAASPRRGQNETTTRSHATTSSARWPTPPASGTRPPDASGRRTRCLRRGRAGLRAYEGTCRAQPKTATVWTFWGGVSAPSPPTSPLSCVSWRRVTGRRRCQRLSSRSRCAVGTSWRRRPRFVLPTSRSLR
ncbi:MAG: hypothetical protein IPI35_29580 [Deltaproteobacteria bacterium]|nr:hypothetical protein [Deltaproteobacteria bacterium]